MSEDAYVIQELRSPGRIKSLTVDQSSSFLSAIDTLQAAAEYALNYRILLQSHIDFEKLLLTMTVDYAYLEPHLTSSNFAPDARVRINLAILTILTAFRAYADQTERQFRQIDGSGSLWNQYRETSGTIYDGSFSYRVVDQLRNHVQHVAVPMSSFSLPSDNEWVDGVPGGNRPSRLHMTISPRLRISNMLSDPKIKKRVKEELDDLGKDYIDLKGLLRTFAAALSQIYSAIYPSILTQVENAESAYNEVLDLLPLRDGKRVFAVQLLQGERVCRSLISGFPKEVTSLLAQPNLGYTYRSYISSRVRVDSNSSPGTKDTVWI